MQQKRKVQVLSSAERAIQSKEFVQPNPGDIMITLVFGWALLCFFLVTLGDRLFLAIVRMARTQAMQAVLMESDQILWLLMIGGSVALVICIATFSSFPKIFAPAFLFSLSFANALWKPVHDVAWAIKYLGMIYLGAYAALFIYKNFWRILSTPYVRIVFAYVAWISAVCVFLGGQTKDFWFMGTEICLLIGLSIAWLYGFNNRFGLEEFYKLLAVAAVVTTVMHMAAPFLVNSYILNGRFQSFFVRATGFSVTFAPVVVLMFWRSMADKDPRMRLFFTAFAFAGLLLILWSGSRSPTAATFMGIAILWWVFRSKIMVVALILAGLGVAIEIIFSAFGAVEVDTLTNRMARTETQRWEVWAEYIVVAARSPLYGFAPSGMSYAIIGGAFGDFLQSQGVSIETFGVHNAYLGLVMRCGLGALTLFLAMIIPALVRARQVIFSKLVPQHEKNIYILPVALIPVSLFTALFEDSVPGFGKGDTNGFLLYTSAVVCHIYGTRLLNQYVRTSSRESEIPMLEGVKLSTDITQTA